MAQLRDPDRPVLVCPECQGKHPGNARIGNRKSTCRTCNRFAQSVRRKVATALAEMHPVDAALLRQDAERLAYRSVTPHGRGGT